MKSKVDIYKEKFNEDGAPGLDAINVKEKEIYGDQEATHWATIVPYELGGPDPLWAIECFRSKKQQEHIHYITLGFTNLWYGEEFADDEVNGFDDFHYMSANGPIMIGTDTEITAFTFYTDPEMGEIDTPNGSVKFLQLYGITGKEYSDLKEKKYTAKELTDKHRAYNPLLITDLNRK